jgi:hypothetical protein
MGSPRLNLRGAQALLAILSPLAFSGCANSCFFAFSNNGSGGLIIRAGDPAPVCAATPMTMRALLVKQPRCETCAATGVTHAFVTVRSIQFRRSALAGANPDWEEIAPRLQAEPLQVDLMSDSLPETLVENGFLPPGTYSQVRLRFLEQSRGSEAAPAPNACRHSRWNCIVTADGHVETLGFPGAAPELIVSIPGLDQDGLVVMPGMKMELRLSFETMPALSFSSAGIERQTMLSASGTVTRIRDLE